MKRRVLLLTLLLSFMLPVFASADIGPKPSVVVDFEGLEGQTYYATLLSPQGAGPWYKTDSFSDSFNSPNTDEAIWNAFNDYDAPDGYEFIGFIDECTDTHQLAWVYYPPETFKVLIYFPEEDRFCVAAKEMKTYAFDSYFTVRLSSPDAEYIDDIQSSYSFGKEALSFAARVVLTLVVELAIALFFGFREKKQLTLILVVNVITQIILNLLLNFDRWGQGSFLIDCFGAETIVFLVEGAIYALALRRLAKDPAKKRHPWVYALVANIASFVFGLVLSQVVPAIF